jgi:hypothetical protein
MPSVRISLARRHSYNLRRVPPAHEALFSLAITVGLAGASLVLTMLFVVRERRAGEPVLPLAMLANRTVALSSTTLFLPTFAVFGAVSGWAHPATGRSKQSNWS